MFHAPSLTEPAFMISNRMPPELRDGMRLFSRRVRRSLFHKGSHALNGLDLKVDAVLKKRGGFFIELGANDGVTQSNTLFFQERRGWTGVLIEPIPHRFMQCLAARGKRAKVRCCACVSADYERPMVEFEYADLMTASAELSNRDYASQRERAAQHFDNATAYRFAVEAKTLTQVLHECEAPASIDLLSLDVEGAEIEVLKGVDFDAFRIGAMLIETAHFDEIAAFLIPRGYRLHSQLSNHDYLFLLD